MPARARSLFLSLLLPAIACTSWAEQDELELPEQIDPLYEDPPAPLEPIEAEPASDDDAVPPSAEAAPTKACEQGIADARDDFAKGTVVLDAYGYPSRCAFEYWDLLERWYGIHTAHHGCIVPDLPDEHWERAGCYRQEVDRLVFAKYGEDAYDKASRKAGCR